MKTKDTVNISLLSHYALQRTSLFTFKVSNEYILLLPGRTGGKLGRGEGALTRFGPERKKKLKNAKQERKIPFSPIKD